jgi:uncharacterized protein GlcG (DUF336 family)
MNKHKLRTRTLEAILFGGLLSAATIASADRPNCSGLPSYGTLQATLTNVVASGGNGGLGNDMWGTVVNRDGQVCAVVFTGADRASQWPGSRVISAQKANTANSFSLTGTYPNAGAGRALATGNLYGLVQPGGSLFGLQESNPVDTAVAYGDPDHEDGDASAYGTSQDPLVGQFVGGVNVFGGGLALYNRNGQLVGAVGVSGDTSCTDHIIAWRVRDGVGLDNIPGGVGDNFTNDNLILADPVTPNTFEHPVCGFGEEDIIANLAATDPIGPNNQ